VRFRPLIAIAIAIAAASLLAACGGGGGSDETTNATGATANATTNSGSTGNEAQGGGNVGNAAEGGGNAETGKQSAASKQFLHEADELCRKDGKEIFADLEALLPPGGLDKTTPEEKEEFVTRVVVPGLQAEIEQLSALEPPPQDAQHLEEVVASMQTNVNRAGEDPAAFVEEGNPFIQTQELAEEYGFQFCGGIGAKPGS